MLALFVTSSFLLVRGKELFRSAGAKGKGSRKSGYIRLVFTYLGALGSASTDLVQCLIENLVDVEAVQYQQSAGPPFST